MKRIILILFLIFTACSVCFAESYTVERVLDGKTLRLDNGEEVSLIGVDFPEIFSQKVSDFTKNLVKGKEVRLEFDVKKRDGNGRLLAYVWYEIGPKSPIADYSVAPEIYARDDKFESWPGELGTFVFLNATLIKAGQASPLRVEPNVKYADLFKKLYEEANASKKDISRNMFEGKGTLLVTKGIWFKADNGKIYMVELKTNEFPANSETKTWVRGKIVDFVPEKPDCKFSSIGCKRRKELIIEEIKSLGDSFDSQGNVIVHRLKTKD